MIESVGRRQTTARGMLGNWVELRGRSLNGYERNKLYRNLGGARFGDYSYQSGADAIGDGRGSAVLDLDSDGRLDLVVQNFQQPAVLLHNRGGESGNWVGFRLEGRRCNRDAIGAFVEVYTDAGRQVRHLSSTAGYLAGQSKQLHFGLGSATTIERVVVHWPGGGESVLRHPPINRRHDLVQPSGDVARASR